MVLIFLFHSLQALCKIYYFVQQTSYTASVVLLTIISVERYIAIMYPLRAKQLFTFHRLKVAQVIMWLLLAAYNCPQLIIFDIVPVWSSSTNTTVEFCYLTAGMTFMRIYNTSNFIVFYVVPFILMSIMYSKIATALWISGTDMNPAMNQQLTQHPPHNGTTRFSMPNRRFRYGTDVTLVSFKKNTIPPDEAGVAFECKNTEKQREFNNILLVNETADPIQNRGDSTSTETTTYDFLSEGFYSDAESEYGDAENNYRVHTTPPFNRKSSNKSNLSRKSSDNGKKISKHKHNQKVKYGVMRFTGKQLMDKRSHPSVKSCDSSNSYSSDRIRSKSTSRIPKTNSIKILQARRKVIRMLVAIVITFAVCVLPHHVRVLMTYWGTIHSSLFTPISVLILYLNSGMNPIVYALLSGTFRRSLRELFLCRRS